MAVYPCSFGAHRYPQRQRSMYISDVASARPETRKHRLCPAHFETIRSKIVSQFDEVTEDSQMSQLCELCSEPRAGGIFVKLFDEAGAEPVQFAIDLCAGCRGQVLTDLSWREALPVGA